MTVVGTAGGETKTMRMKKILIPLYRDEVAPRFDLATEALIVSVSEDGTPAGRQNLILPHASADELCDLVLSREIDTVICGGIEEEYYHYLRWKRVDVLDAVAGSVEAALDSFFAGRLKSGDMLFGDRSAHV